MNRTHHHRRLQTWLLTGAFIAVAGGCAASPGPEGDFESATPRDSDRAAEEVIERIDRGSDDWNASCTMPGVSGLCATFVPAPDDANGCASSILGEVVVGSRSNAVGQRGQDELARALAMASSLEEPDDEDLRGHYRRAQAVARLAQTDRAIESYLALAPPRGADATDEATAEFFREKIERGSELVQALAEIKAYGDQALIVAAALRTSWVSAQLADNLRTAQPPAALRDDAEGRTRYCGALREHAQAPAQLAEQAAKYCRERAADASYEGPEVAACAALLTALERSITAD